MFNGICMRDMTQGMDIIAKKLPVHPMVILCVRELLQTPQVNKSSCFNKANVPFQLLPPIIHAKQNPFPKGQLWLLALRWPLSLMHEEQRGQGWIQHLLLKVGHRWHELDSSLLRRSNTSSRRCHCNGCHKGRQQYPNLSAPTGALFIADMCH